MSLVENREQQQANRSDEELIEGIRRCNEADFTALYERYFQRVYNFCYIRLRNHADAEEVVQETFSAVFRSVDSFQGKSSVLSWIYGVAKNTVNNTIRQAVAREQRVGRAESELVHNLRASSERNPEESLMLRRCTDSILQQFEMLSDWQAEIFVMRHVENLPIREIAIRTSRSNDAVRSSLCRVKRLLVEAVEDVSVSGSAAAMERGLL